MSFLKELQRRNVFKVAIAYIVTAWLVLQVADVILNNIAAPGWIFHVLLLILTLGLPFAVIFAWAFELTPEGLRRESTSGDAAPGAPRSRANLEVLVFAAVLFALVYLAFSRLWLDEPDPVEQGQIRSIAVLPLQNLMNDPGQAYFVEGMHEALITELSKIDALRVISRTSSMHFKDSGKSVPEIALELGVDAVVEGSVLRAGNVVRITAQLIEARTDRHVWAENYDRELNDILALYADVTREIVNHIKVQVSPDEIARLSETAPVNAEVYELYLKGRHLCGNWSPEEMRQGAKLLQQAIDLDPQHAPSHAQLAMCLQDSAFFEYVKPLEIDQRASAAALTAVQLDDQSAEARVALGGVNYYLGFDPKAAEPEYMKALELNPNNVDVLLRLSWFLGEGGRFQEALETTRHALGLDPLSTAVINAMGQIHYLNGNQEQAIQEYQKALELSRSDPSLNYYLGGAFEEQGDHEKAISLYRIAIDLSGGAPLYRSALGHVLGATGKEAEAREILEDLQQQDEPSPYNLAVIHLGLGDHEQAIDLLEQAFEARNGHLLYIKEGPRFDPLRENERFVNLVRRFGW